MTDHTPIYRAAIIGTGRIASTYDDEIVTGEQPSFYQGENRHVGLYTVQPVNHAAAYQSTPGFELVAAANRSRPKLQTFGSRWGVSALYDDYRALLAAERPDVVSVCTQSPEKAEVTVAAAEAGVKAIIVEKAMATSMAEADAMLAACRRHGVLLAVNHPYRFSPIIRQARRLIQDGELGTLGSVTAHAPGGMLHIGTHIFDLLRFWAGDALEIQARVPNYAPEQDLPAVGMVRFAHDVVGFFDHTHRATPSAEARGDRGYLTASTMVGDGWLHRVQPMYATDARRKYPNRLTLEPILGEPHSVSPTQRLLRELHSSLSTGAPLVSTGEDGAAALELGLACYVSHLAGGPVTLPLADRSLRVPNR